MINRLFHRSPGRDCRWSTWWYLQRYLKLLDDRVRRRSVLSRGSLVPRLGRLVVLKVSKVTQRYCGITIHGVIMQRVRVLGAWDGSSLYPVCLLWHVLDRMPHHTGNVTLQRIISFFNRSMDDLINTLLSVERNYLSIPKIQRCSRWSLRMDA